MTATETLVTMLIIAWVPTPDGTLKEAWRIEDTTTLQHCLLMNTISGGGKNGAITVKCGITPEQLIALAKPSEPAKSSFLCGLNLFFHRSCQ